MWRDDLLLAQTLTSADAEWHEVSSHLLSIAHEPSIGTERGCIFEDGLGIVEGHGRGADSRLNAVSDCANTRYEGNAYASGYAPILEDDIRLRTYTRLSELSALL
jgi:hypothetical protein